MSVQTEFSRYAEEYGSYNVIQRRVVAKLLKDLGDERPRRILDLGCGNGVLCEALTWRPEHFLGIDFAPRMLELHPKGSHIECIYGDFNNPLLFEQLRYLEFDRIFSGSALQWSRDLDRTFAMIASLNAPVSLALFTANTFATLFKTAGIAPLLRSAEEVAASESGGSGGGPPLVRGCGGNGPLPAGVCVDAGDVPLYQAQRGERRAQPAGLPGDEAADGTLPAGLPGVRGRLYYDAG